MPRRQYQGARIETLVNIRTSADNSGLDQTNQEVAELETNLEQAVDNAQELSSAMRQLASERLTDAELASPHANLGYTQFEQAFRQLGGDPANLTRTQGLFQQSYATDPELQNAQQQAQRQINDQFTQFTTELLRAKSNEVLRQLNTLSDTATPELNTEIQEVKRQITSALATELDQIGDGIGTGGIQGASRHFAGIAPELTSLQQNRQRLGLQAAPQTAISNIENLFQESNRIGRSYNNYIDNLTAANLIKEPQRPRPNDPAYSEFEPTPFGYPVERRGAPAPPPTRYDYLQNQYQQGRAFVEQTARRAYYGQDLPILPSPAESYDRFGGGVRGFFLRGGFSGAGGIIGGGSGGSGGYDGTTGPGGTINNVHPVFSNIGSGQRYLLGAGAILSSITDQSTTLGASIGLGGGILQAGAGVFDPYLWIGALQTIGFAMRTLIESGRELAQLERSYRNISASILGPGGADQAAETLDARLSQITTQGERDRFGLQLITTGLATTPTDQAEYIEILSGLATATGQDTESALQRFVSIYSNRELKGLSDFAIDRQEVSAEIRRLIDSEGITYSEAYPRALRSIAGDTYRSLGGIGLYDESQIQANYAAQTGDNIARFIHSISETIARSLSSTFDPAGFIAREAARARAANPDYNELILDLEREYRIEDGQYLDANNIFRARADTYALSEQRHQLDSIFTSNRETIDSILDTINYQNLDIIDSQVLNAIRALRETPLDQGSAQSQLYALYSRVSEPNYFLGVQTNPGFQLDAADYEQLSSSVLENSLIARQYNFARAQSQILQAINTDSPEIAELLDQYSQEFGRYQQLGFVSEERRDQLILDIPEYEDRARAAIFKAIETIPLDLLSEPQQQIFHEARDDLARALTELATGWVEEIAELPNPFTAPFRDLLRRPVDTESEEYQRRRQTEEAYDFFGLDYTSADALETLAEDFRPYIQATAEYSGDLAGREQARRFQAFAQQQASYDPELESFINFLEGWQGETLGPEYGENADLVYGQNQIEDVSAIDGDTFIGRYRGNEYTFRILGIDTPERGEPGYEAATSYLESELTSGGQLTLFTDPSEDPQDQYGRNLVHAFVGGRSVAGSLIASGLSDFTAGFGGRFFNRDQLFFNQHSDIQLHRPELTLAQLVREITTSADLGAQERGPLVGELEQARLQLVDAIDRGSQSEVASLVNEINSLVQRYDEQVANDPAADQSDLHERQLAIRQAAGDIAETALTDLARDSALSDVATSVAGIRLDIFSGGSISGREPITQANEEAQQLLASIESIEQSRPGAAFEEGLEPIRRFAESLQEITGEHLVELDIVERRRGSLSGLYGLQDGSAATEFVSAVAQSIQDRDSRNDFLQEASYYFGTGNRQLDALRDPTSDTGRIFAELARNAPNDVTFRTIEDFTRARSLPTNEALSDEQIINFLLRREGIQLDPVRTETVVGGDTLSGIAFSSGISLARLRELNPNLPSDPRLLQIGTQINTGGAGGQGSINPFGGGRALFTGSVPYEVLAGDTLSSIALASGLSLAQLRELNPNLPSDPRLLQIGTQINTGAATGVTAQSPDILTRGGADIPLELEPIELPPIQAENVELETVRMTAQSVYLERIDAGFGDEPEPRQRDTGTSRPAPTDFREAQRDIERARTAATRYTNSILEWFTEIQQKRDEIQRRETLIPMRVVVDTSELDDLDNRGRDGEADGVQYTLLPSIPNTIESQVAGPALTPGL